MNAIRGAIACALFINSLVVGWQQPVSAQTHVEVPAPILDIPRASDRFLEEGREAFEAETRRLTQGQPLPAPDLLQGEETIDIQEELQPLESGQRSEALPSSQIVPHK